MRFVGKGDARQMAELPNGPNLGVRVSLDPPPPAGWWDRAMDRWGLPTVAAVLLGALLYQFVSRDLVTMQAASLETQRLISEHVAESRLDQTEVRYLLRQICLNGADTEAERAACVLPRVTR